MNEIAKRAWVGAGTPYRHFPAREDLILAVYQRDIAQVTASVEAFTRWFDQLAAYVRVKHGLDPADVVQLMGFLWRVDPGPAGLAQAGRLTGIVLDGIRKRDH
jgi:AcrR family transcriptional regulator